MSWVKCSFSFFAKNNFGTLISTNINKSIYFKDAAGSEHFLFRILNYGKNEDQLKFIFNQKSDGTAIIFSPDHSLNSKDDVIRPYAEITYHNDGRLQQKLSTNKPYIEGIDRVTKTPLSKILDWEPIIKYTIIDYKTNKRTSATNDFIMLKNDYIFDGSPFECIINLGHRIYANPPNNQLNELIYRINDITKNIDMIIWIVKSNYPGKIIAVPNSNIRILNKSNVIEIVEKRNKST